jgi:D-glycero-alpha-D-manno-heptose-7-phosphate kinase
VIEASAPIRICDNGGWTDTWFGGPGRVLNIAVAPGVEVSIRPTTGPDPVVIDVHTFGDRYPIVPGEPRDARHPLLEAAIDSFPPPRDVPVEIGVRSAVPAGCGTGTSAAVAVALVGGLARVRSEPLSPRATAYAAHRLEVDILGIQSGIQDQLSAALGGINYLEVEPFPEATVHRLPDWDALSSRLTLVFLGRPHNSSDLHRRVIEDGGRGAAGVLSRLRDAAQASRDAVLSRDLDAFGRAMIANTQAQESLHPALVGGDARRMMAMAMAQGAIGWKVNGAGGNGGSVTILSRSGEAKEALERETAVLDGRYRVLPIQVSNVGLRVRGALQPPTDT